MARELSDAEQAAALRDWPVARFATLGKRGAHLVPVVFAEHQGLLWIPIDGKPKSTGQLMRISNIERDPRVTVLLDHYSVDWTELWWLRAEGIASVRQGDTFGEQEQRAADRLREKYQQYRTTRPFSDKPTLIRIEVERQRTWAVRDTPLSFAAERGDGGPGLTPG